MDAPELWKRYRQYFCRVDSLELSLDISRMHFDEAFLTSMEPAMQKAFKEMDALESGAIANPDEKRMVGHYWLRSPQLAPTKDIAMEITGTVDSIQKLVAGVHAGKIKPPMAERFTQVLAIGIGGSALGPMFVGDALGEPSADRMKVHFIDNTDPDGIARMIESLKGFLPETLVIVTSKSGGTPDTRNGMVVVAEAYRAAHLNFARHVRLGRRPDERAVGSGPASRGVARNRHCPHARRSGGLRCRDARSRNASQSRRADGFDVVCGDGGERKKRSRRSSLQGPPALIQPLFTATRDGIAGQATRSRRPPRRARNRGLRK